MNGHLLISAGEALQRFSEAVRPSERNFKVLARKTGCYHKIGGKMAFSQDDIHALMAVYSRLQETRMAAVIRSVAPPVSHIYFVRCRDRIKIGRARNPARRLVEIRVHCPYPVKLLWTCPGGPKEERQFHKQFAHLHLHGEWFKFRQEIENLWRKPKGIIHDRHQPQ